MEEPKKELPVLVVPRPDASPKETEIGNKVASNLRNSIVDQCPMITAMLKEDGVRSSVAVDMAAWVVMGGALQAMIVLAKATGHDCAALSALVEREWLEVTLVPVAAGAMHREVGQA